MKTRRRNRLPHYDYSKDGYYFVTICTKNHKSWFGKVVEGKMVLNKLGMIAGKHWEDIPNHFKNINLDLFIIMPNHVHGIVIINNPYVGNSHGHSLQTQRMKMLLPNVINGFKSSVTRTIRKQFGDCKSVWQKSYYDHIIRNDKSLLKIQEYILNNPIKWELDKYNPKNLM